MSTTLNKPYGVTFTMLGRNLLKQFDTESEQKAFATQLSKKGLQYEMHKKASEVSPKPKPAVKSVTTSASAQSQSVSSSPANSEVIEGQKRGMEGRATSIGFVKVLAPNVSGGVWYRPVKVPYRTTLLFCSNCHDYRRFTKVTSEYGMVFNQCPECGVPDSDFNTQINNGLNKF